MEETNYLILLVGKNPSPNFISALAHCNKNTKLFLIYTNKTDKIISTYKVAENIEKTIKAYFKNISIEKIGVDKNNIESIERCINNLKLPKDARVILDLTGSTKIISAVFYNKICEINNKNIYFSYVSDKTNEVNIFDINNKKIKNLKNIDIAKKYGISATDILRVHGVESINNESFNDFTIKKVSNEGFLLHLDFKANSPISRKKDLINIFFDINSKAEKLGGSNVTYSIYIKKDKNNMEKLIDLEEKFFEDIKNITQINNIKEKIKLIVLED